MNKFSTLIIAVTGLLGGQYLNAQNCDSFEIQLNKEVQAKNYDAAYPILNQALSTCPNQKINLYNFGETILLDKISKASETEKQKYASELVSLLDKRVKNFPDEKKSFWEGEKITYQQKYGLLDRPAVYNAYKNLFTSSDDTQKVSANTVLTYYTTALELMNEQQLEFDEVMEVYFQTKKVAEDNIEMRSVEYGTLAEKLDSIKQVNPKNDLTPAEKQTMANAQAAKDVFVEVNESMEAVLQEYTTCENIAPMFVNKYEANKENMEWLIGAYQSLESKECFDQPIMEQIEKQYMAVWKKKNPQAEPTAVVSRGGGAGSGTMGGSYSDGARKFKAGNYSGAIASFEKAMYEVSGTTRGDVAYYIALSYQKTGSNSNAVSWAHRAAGYKPGWGAPYQLIASAFAAVANSCGSNEFQKRAAYWVAADYANKACAVDSRSCSWGRSAAKSYEGNAPSAELAFQNGKNKGDSVSVSCLGGATTRVR